MTALKTNIIAFLNENIEVLKRNILTRHELDKLDYSKFDIPLLVYRLMIQSLFHCRQKYKVTKRAYELKTNYLSLLDKFIEELTSEPKKHSSFENYYYVKFTNEQFIINIDDENDYKIYNLATNTYHKYKVYRDKYIIFDMMSRHLKLHQLIASTFHIHENNNLKILNVVDHKNRRIHDNSLVNLHYTTQWKNMLNKEKYSPFEIFNDELHANYKLLSTCGTNKLYPNTYYISNDNKYLLTHLYDNTFVKRNNRRGIILYLLDGESTCKNNLILY